MLAVHTRFDGVLSAVAPLGLAASAGTALVIDLDPDGPAYPSRRSLAELVAEGPRRDDLVPVRSGVAVLRNGGVPAEAAGEVLEALLRSWPALVLRCGTFTIDYPIVPVIPLFTGVLAPDLRRPAEAQGPGFPRPAVYQATAAGERAPGPGPILPRLCRRLLLRLLSGVVEPRSRWVRAWRPVWDMPWH